MKKLFLWIIYLVIVGAILVGVYFLARGENTPKRERLLSVPVSADDNQKGATNAKVTLVEYGDFQCPACLSYYPFVTRLMREFPTMLRVVFRDFPMTTVHAHAQAAAEAAEAAGKQGELRERHNAAI